MLFNPTYDPGDVIAVGDIHGRYDLFSAFLDHVRDSQTTVILLGDLIDRGGQDVAVLNKIKELLDDPQKNGLANFHCLKGNHEQMMLDAADGLGFSFVTWAKNGGNMEETDKIFKHADWIRALPVYLTIGETMFIHAGFYPGHDPEESLAQGRLEGILWMREPFLKLGPLFEEWNPNLKRVVFGHTPRSAMPYVIPGGGICIDTAAYHTGVLTSYNVTRDTFWQYDLPDAE